MVSHAEILALLEELAPSICAEPGDEPHFEACYGEAANHLGVCTDPTERNIFLAASDGVDFLITHHQWRGEGAEVVAAKELSIYRLHSAWDLAPEGNAVTLGRMLGLRDLVLREGTVSGAADLDFREIIERSQRIVGRSIVPYCGDLSARVANVGIIPGAGFLPFFRHKWEMLIETGCDTLISAEISFSAARFAQCAGVRLVDLGHSGLAKPGFAHLAYLLRTRLKAHGCEVEFYDDAYAVNYATAWSLSGRETAGDKPETPNGIVLPFPRT